MQSKKYSVCFIFLFNMLFLNATAQEISKASYMPPAQKQRMLGNITLIQNIRYAPIPEIALDSTSDRILDLYLPQNIQNKDVLPVFMFIHGGGFTGGDKNLLDLCSKIANQGFAVVSI